MSVTLNISAPTQFQSEMVQGRRSSPDNRFGFVLLVLLTANLFIRPLELIPALRDVRIHQILTAFCLIALFSELTRELSWSSLCARPARGCIVGTAIAIILSALRRFTLY